MTVVVHQEITFAPGDEAIAEGGEGRDEVPEHTLGGGAIDVLEGSRPIELAEDPSLSGPEQHRAIGEPFDALRSLRDLEGQT